MFVRFFLYLNTIRYLKISQIYGRLIYKYKKPFTSSNLPNNIRQRKACFVRPIKKKSSLLKENIFFFLNRRHNLSEIGWQGENSSISKLWLYNLHYFDFLLDANTDKLDHYHKKLLVNWINENKIGYGVGWESYPLSLRIVNWIKWDLKTGNLTEKCRISLATQCNFLSQKIEWHLLGNHLFKNAKALVFSGLYFKGRYASLWLKKGLEIISDQLSEQTLADGGNFELSTMYHSIFLEDLLDLYNMSLVFPGSIPHSEIRKWKKNIRKMLYWLKAMTHPDGDISFFNDASFEVSAKFSELMAYSKRLGIDYVAKIGNINHLDKSGYIRFHNNFADLFIDVAKVGADYIPGHAHADTLSFELSLFGQRVFVNLGTSEYGNTSIRNIERSTESHNTVKINNINSSEVWDSFRVARRAEPYNLRIKSKNSNIEIECEHNGYKRLKGKPIHHRKWKLSNTSIILEDKIKGSFDCAFGYLHLHPDIKIQKTKDKVWNLKLQNGNNLSVIFDHGDPELIDSYFASEFGKRIKTSCIRIKFLHDRTRVNLRWNI